MWVKATNGNAYNLDGTASLQVLLTHNSPDRWGLVLNGGAGPVLAEYDTEQLARDALSVVLSQIGTVIIPEGV